MYKQGEAADKFFILIAGRANAWVSQPAPPGSSDSTMEFQVAVLNELEVFGEECLLDDGARVRNATLTASEPVQALSLRRDDWVRLSEAGVLGADVEAGV